MAELDINEPVHEFVVLIAFLSIEGLGIEGICAYSPGPYTLTYTNN